jgi:hypothetical protein
MSMNKISKHEHAMIEVIIMASYIGPGVRDKFETLSVNLKNVILERNVHIETIYDLMHVLEDIVKEGESE